MAAVLRTHTVHSHTRTDRRHVEMAARADFQGNGKKTEGTRVTRL